MREMISQLHEWVVNPGNFFAAAFSGMAHLGFSVVYFNLVDLTVSQLKNTSSHAVWFFWAMLLVDEVVLGFFLFNHVYQVSLNLYGQGTCRLWKLFKRMLRAWLEKNPD